MATDAEIARFAEFAKTVQSNKRKPTKHPMTKRCEIAVRRAEVALAKARMAHEKAESDLRDAEDDLARARYDLSLNQEIDEH